MACNFTWTMLDASKIAQVVAHTPRTSNHLHAPETDLNNHHQKAKVRTSADKSTNVVLSDIYWITPRLQKWDVEPKIFTELLATYCRPRKCLWLRHHVVLCRLLNLLNLLCVDSFFPSKKWLKWNWNGHWEWLQEAWTLKIGSDEPEMCWGCVGGHGLFVVSKRGSQQSIEQLNGSGIFEVSSPHESSSREIWFRRAIRPTPYHTKGGWSGLE